MELRTSGGVFTELFTDLYNQIENRKNLAQIVRMPPGLSPYLSLFGEATEFKDLPPLPIPSTTTINTLVAFSGGKDSTAIALKSVNPILAHVAGINRSFPHERLAAKRIAERLGLELKVFFVSASGKNTWLENPIKNQLILALLVDWGVDNEVMKYAQGTHTKKVNVSIEQGYSDSLEMNQRIVQFYQGIYPAFSLQWLQCETESFVTLYRKDPELLSLVSSCMMPLRYKKRLTKHNESKYGIDLLPGRCGSCWKCAEEYLHLAILEGRHCNDFVIKCKSTVKDHYKQVFPKSGWSSSEDLLDWVIEPTLLNSASIKDAWFA